MRVLITGGAGFIGSHVVELVARKGNEVQVVDDLSTGNLDWLHNFSLSNKHVHYDLCDIRDRGHVRAEFMAFRPQIVMHLAAQPAISTSWENPRINAEVNELGTLNLIDSAKEFFVTRMIFASTSAVYHDNNHVLFEYSAIEPVTPYGISKMAAEHYLRALTTESVILRLGNVYGPRQVPIGKNQVIPLMFRFLLHGDEFKITGDGKQKRDWVFVGDVAEAFLAAMWGKAGTYNIASGHSVSVTELARAVEASCGLSGQYGWAYTAEQDPRREVAMDISAAREGLDWKPSHCLKDGLKLTAEWWNTRK